MDSNPRAAIAAHHNHSNASAARVESPSAIHSVDFGFGARVLGITLWMIRVNPGFDSESHRTWRSGSSISRPSAETGFALAWRGYDLHVLLGGFIYLE